MSSASNPVSIATPALDRGVEHVEVIDVALPTRRDWRWRGMHEDLGRWSIIRVTTAHGTIGWGEATPLGSWGGDRGRYFGETPTTVRHVIEDVLSPILLGADPFELHRLRSRMDDAIKGHVYAKAAIEMALYDIQGKLVDLPLSTLLGGRVRDGVPIAHMIGIMEIADASREALAAAEEGVGAFQLKGTGVLERDVALVRSLRDHLGDQVVLRLDANQGYRQLGAKAAIHAAQALEAAGANMIEQPTEGVAQMAAVRAGAGVMVIADESCWQPADLLDIGCRDAADGISIYISKAGSIDGARQLADLARTLGFPCDVNGSLESGIGNAANIQFAIASAAVSLACVIPVTTIPDGRGPNVAGRYFDDDLVTASFPYADGILSPPPGPGLGVVVDEEKLQHFRTR